MTPAVIGLCLALDLGSGHDPVHQARLPWQEFTLAWTHSIEKVRWEEDYRLVLHPTQGWVLEAAQARIRGSGAGMEPPEAALWQNGWYVYTPQVRHTPALRLSHSEFTADYEMCHGGHCRPLRHWVGAANGVTLVQPCPPAGQNAPPSTITPPPAPGSSG